MAVIKNIIFDLGGVLFNIHFNETFERLSSIMGEDLTQSNWSPEFYEMYVLYETGKIDSNQFIQFLQKKSHPKNPTSDEVKAAWNSMLKGWFHDTFSALESLNTKYALYLLSNINDMHFNHLKNSLLHHGGIEYFNSYFKETYYSHLCGYRKPDPMAWLQILEQNGLQPAHTLFIDDTAEHVEAAKSCGLWAYQYNREDDLHVFLLKIIS